MRASSVRGLTLVLALGSACGATPAQAIGGGSSGDTGGTTEAPSNATTSTPGTTSAATAAADSGTTMGVVGEGSSSSGEPAATSTGEAASTSTGDATSTGIVRVTCEDLMLPEDDPAECSVSGGMPAELVIINECESITLETWWVNYTGQGCYEEFIVAVTPPGEMDTIGTYVTHPFRVRDQASGTLMLEIPGVAPGTTMVTVP